jgi:hypothetical protein
MKIEAHSDASGQVRHCPVSAAGREFNPFVDPYA